MENVIKMCETGVVNFCIYCEDNESIVERMGVEEVKLPSENNSTLELIMNNTNGVPEMPLYKQQIENIEIRAAIQEKDPDTKNVTVWAVKHIFLVTPKSFDGNLEKYSVTHWKTFIDNKKVRDIRANTETAESCVIDLDDLSGYELTAEQQKEFKEKTVMFIENDHEAGMLRIAIPTNALPTFTREQRAKTLTSCLVDLIQKEL